MSVSYPLYDYLVKKIDERTEKNIDIRKICTTINSICRTMPSGDMVEHYKEIYALVIHHELLSNGGILLSATPFEPKIMEGGKGILNFIMNFPPQLQQIIAQYISEYSENLELTL